MPSVAMPHIIAMTLPRRRCGMKPPACWKSPPTSSSRRATRTALCCLRSAVGFVADLLEHIPPDEQRRRRPRRQEPPWRDQRAPSPRRAAGTDTSSDDEEGAGGAWWDAAGLDVEDVARQSSRVALGGICELLLEECLARGSTDNISAVIVILDHSLRPKPSVLPRLEGPRQRKQPPLAQRAQQMRAAAAVAAVPPEAGYLPAAAGLEEDAPTGIGTDAPSGAFSVAATRVAHALTAHLPCSPGSTGSGVADREVASTDADDETQPQKRPHSHSRQQEQWHQTEQRHFLAAASHANVSSAPPAARLNHHYHSQSHTASKQAHAPDATLLEATASQPPPPQRARLHVPPYAGRLFGRIFPSSSGDGGGDAHLTNAASSSMDNTKECSIVPTGARGSRRLLLLSCVLMACLTMAGMQLLLRSVSPATTVAVPRTFPAQQSIEQLEQQRKERPGSQSRHGRGQGHGAGRAAGARHPHRDSRQKRYIV
jgi:hypothetical protein